MSTPLIRPARPEEYDRVGALAVTAYTADRPMGSYTAELRKAAERAAHGVLLVAADADAPEPRLLGTVTVLLEPGPWRELAAEEDAEIRMLAVDPAARGHGVGGALATAAVDVARSAGCRRVVLSTQSAAGGAQRLYERLGFRRRPDLDWSPRPGVDLLGYVLDL